jgi:hypothetical protein
MNLTIRTATNSWHAIVSRADSATKPLVRSVGAAGIEPATARV